jgi:hypothetical protein
MGLSNQPLGVVFYVYLFGKKPSAERQVIDFYATLSWQSCLLSMSLS